MTRKSLRPDISRWHHAFFIRETLSFNLIYVAACYLVGTGMCHNMVGLLQHYYRRKYVHKILVNRLVKLSLAKSVVR